MIETFRRWTLLTYRYHARLLPTVAFRLLAAASMWLATYGAMAAGSTTLLPQICVAADIRITMLIEAHGEAQDVAAETLAQAFLTVLDARRACNEGQVDAAMQLYESIPLGDGMSRSK